MTQSGRGALFDYGTSLDGSDDSTSLRNANELKSRLSFTSTATQRCNQTLETPRIPDITDYCIAYATPKGIQSNSLSIVKVTYPDYVNESMIHWIFNDTLDI